jgi:hypothetical protein
MSWTILSQPITTRVSPWKGGETAAVWTADGRAALPSAGSGEPVIVLEIFWSQALARVRFPRTESAALMWISDLERPSSGPWSSLPVVQTFAYS